MGFFAKRDGTVEHVQILPEVHQIAHDAGMTVAEHINRTYGMDPQFDASRGTAFAQICASEGLVMPSANQFGLRSAVINDILNGDALVGGGKNAANNSNVSNIGSPFGSAARTLFPVAVLAIVEDILAKDRVTDGVVFDQLVGTSLGIAGDNFIQPQVKYSNVGGPEQAKAQRVTEFGEMGKLLQIGTSEKIRSLPAFTMGIEFSDKARQSLTIDTVALTIARYMQVEKDERVYGYLSALFNGDNDLIIGAIQSVTSSTLNGSATAGVLTHRAWMKFLARHRKYRRITHVMCDIDTYLKIEGRTGRPGSNNYDPTLVRLDPQARPINQTNIGFANDVQYFIVDSATEGGPVPANTVWAIDAPKAITRVTNTQAAYSASVEFALRRSTAMRWDWAESVMRTWGDSELRPFDVLVID